MLMSTTADAVIVGGGVIGTSLAYQLAKAGLQIVLLEKRAKEVVLRRRVIASEVMLESLDQPLGALAAYCRRVLDSDCLLEELVRDIDVEWGRVMAERPHFEKAGAPSDPDDPYTVARVRSSLSDLLEQMVASK